MEMLLFCFFVIILFYVCMYVCMHFMYLLIFLLHLILKNGNKNVLEYDLIVSLYGMYYVLWVKHFLFCFCTT